MAPTALSVLMTVFPDGPERNRALGIWGGIGGVGATAGLLLGGPVTAAFGWQAVFFINVPVGLAPGFRRCESGMVSGSGP
jgi:MFS family permease